LSLFYKLAYRLGFAPWEKAATHPAAVRQINALFDREERGQSPPYGAALDLGCGRGHWSIVLAQRGWQVTGIDLEPRALTAAKGRAAEAGVPVAFLHGDITALRSAGVASGIRLVWDFGTIHGLPDAARATDGKSPPWLRRTPPSFCSHGPLGGVPRYPAARAGRIWSTPFRLGTSWQRSPSIRPACLAPCATWTPASIASSWPKRALRRLQAAYAAILPHYRRKPDGPGRRSWGIDTLTAACSLAERASGRSLSAV
jgi:hypothetical protein